MASYSFRNNFTSGELSPNVDGREDLVAYQNGALTMENALPKPQGGIKRRPGSVFVARALDKSVTCRLIPFKFSVTQNYMLEVGNAYMRFHTQNARLEETAVNVSNAADNGSGVIRITTSGAHGYTTGDYIAIRAVGGTYEAIDDWQVTVIDATNFDLDGSVFTNTYTSGGTASKIVQISTPWATADLPDIRYAQDADVMFMVHPSYWPHRLTRTSATTFTLTKLDNVVDTTEERWLRGPFQPLNADTAHTMTPSATTGSINVTSSSAYFTDDMVGMYMRIGDEVAGEQGLVRFTSKTSTTVMASTVESTLSGTGATANWALGSWGEEVGYPAEVTFFEQRLCFARTTSEPQTVWMSSTTNPYDFRIGTDDDEPVTFTIRADDVNVIQWISSFESLLIGTQGSEYFVTGGANAAVTPTNIFVRQQSAFGSEPVRAVKVGGQVLYAQRGGERVRDMSFSFEDDKFLSDDLTILADHIFDGDGVAESTFQLSPDPIVWFCSDAGLLVSLTLLRGQQVAAWARHPLGGDGLVESVAVIPATSIDNDELWIVAKRTINGTTVRYIEYLKEGAIADSSLEGTITPSLTVSGLNHLEGEEVVIQGDGAVYVNRTVTAGAITADAAEETITNAKIGLGYTPTIKPTPPNFPLANGSTYGRKKRHARLLIFARDTMTLTLDGYTADARSTEDLMGSAPSASGDVFFKFSPRGSAELLTYTITQPLPLDFNIKGVYGEVEINDL